MVAERALSIRAKDLMFGDTRAARRSGPILNVVKLFLAAPAHNHWRGDRVRSVR